MAPLLIPPPEAPSPNTRPHVRDIFSQNGESARTQAPELTPQIQDLLADDTPIDVLITIVKSVLSDDVAPIHALIAQLMQDLYIPDLDEIEVGEPEITDDYIRKMVESLTQHKAGITSDFEALKELLSNTTKGELQLAAFVLEYLKHVANICTIGELTQQAKTGFPMLLIGLFK
ncbi:MAG: hypothetical protein O3A01_08310 [bacterium]|nr:hypothetical protein [bacterium]